VVDYHIDICVQPLSPMDGVEWCGSARVADDGCSRDSGIVSDCDSSDPPSPGARQSPSPAVNRRLDFAGCLSPADEVIYSLVVLTAMSVPCFDAVGWAAGRASGL